MQAFFSAPRSWRRTEAADAFPQFLEVEAGSGEPLFEFLRNGTSLLKETSEQIAQMRPTAAAARIRLRVPAAPDSGSERLLSGKGLAAERGASASHADSVDASHGRRERAQKLARFTFIQRHGLHGVVRLGYFRPAKWGGFRAADPFGTDHIPVTEVCWRGGRFAPHSKLSSSPHLTSNSAAPNSSSSFGNTPVCSPPVTCIIRSQRKRRNRRALLPPPDGTLSVGKFGAPGRAKLGKPDSADYRFSKFFISRSTRGFT